MAMAKLLLNILGLLLTISVLALGSIDVPAEPEPEPEPFIISGNNILYSADQVGSVLPPGKSLTISSYTLTIEENCNLALYDKTRLAWETKTGGMGYHGCELTLLNNAKLVIRDKVSRKEVWSSGIAKEKDHYVFVLQRDRNLVIYGPPVWSTETFTFPVPPGVVSDANMLYSRDQVQSTLQAKSSLTMGSYALTLNADCNLVLSDRNKKVWETNTHRPDLDTCYLTLLKDGNLVIRDLDTQTEVWSSRSGGADGPYVFLLQRDRNLVIYGPPVWLSNSNAFIVAHNQTATEAALAA